MTSDLLSTAQAAELLGVRTATIYSYVSRGVLTRAGSASRHDGSLFRRADVIALRDNRIRRRSGIFEVTIATAITRIDPAGRLFYRGHDVTELARDSTFERTAEILWETAELDWSPNAASTRAARVARESAATSSPAARARLAVATLAPRRCWTSWPSSHPARSTWPTPSSSKRCVPPGSTRTSISHSAPSSRPPVRARLRRSDLHDRADRRVRRAHGRGARPTAALPGTGGVRRPRVTHIRIATGVVAVQADPHTANSAGRSWCPGSARECAPSTRRCDSS